MKNTAFLPSLGLSSPACSGRRTDANVETRRSGRRLIPSAPVLLLLLGLAALAAPNRSFAQAPTFNTVIATPTGSQPWQFPGPAAVGDFDRDGKLDAMIFDGSPTLRFMRGNGDGTFARTDINVPPITASNAVGLNPAFTPYLPHPIDGVIRAIKAADVNGDGKLDIVCLFVVHINFAPLWGTTVLINGGNDANGVPQFTTATHYFAPFADTRSLTVGDLNGDGKPDFIVGGAYGQLQVYLNNGDGTFASGQSTTILPNVGGAVGAGVIADVNGDGKADFIVTSGQANATDVFLGNGDGTLQAPTIVSPAASCIAVADLNKDGKPDLIEGLGDGSVSVYLGNGNGTFGSPANFTSGASSWPSGFFISDVNGDGNLDVAVSLPSIAKVAILTGNGDGTLSSPYLYGSIPNAVDVTLADFTGDGKPDIASASANGYGGQNYDVLLNTTVFPTPAQIFFTDALTGPTSPNLASIPAGKYSYTAAGLQRTQSSSSTDRPMVDTGLSTYLTTSNFVAELTVTVANDDLLFFGVGQGDTDAGYDNEPSHAFYFRVHNNFQGYFGIQADVRSFSTDPSSGYQAINEIGTYSPGSTITLRIVRNGDTITMSIVGGGSVSYSLSAYNASLGLTDTNTRVFFGNTSVGSVFSNLHIYPMPLPVVTSATISQGYGTAFSYPISATGSPTSYTATGLPAGLSIDASTGVISGTLPNTVGTYAIAVSASNAGGTGTGTLTLNIVDNVPPVLSFPSSIIAEATSPAGAVVTFNVSANDAIDGAVPVTVSPPSGSTFPLGTVTVTVSATDAAGNTAHGVFPVTVRDTTPPTLTVPANQVLEATSPAGAVATFAATATDAVTVNPAIAYSVNGVPVSSGGTFPLGTTTVTVTATDAAGNASTGKFTITVRDTTPPVITSLTPSSAVLWPPNHNLVPITVNVSATDAVGVTSLRIVSVTSNEPDNGLGDGDTANDIVFTTNPVTVNGTAVTGGLALSLRAERSGTGNGRVYTITVQASDAAGNLSLTRTVTVSVPKSQGNTR